MLVVPFVVSSSSRIRRGALKNLGRNGPGERARVRREKSRLSVRTEKREKEANVRANRDPLDGTDHHGEGAGGGDDPGAKGEAGAVRVPTFDDFASHASARKSRRRRRRRYTDVRVEGARTRGDGVAATASGRQRRERPPAARAERGAGGGGGVKVAPVFVSRSYVPAGRVSRRRRGPCASSRRRSARSSGRCGDGVPRRRRDEDEDGHAEGGHRLSLR